MSYMTTYTAFDGGGKGITIMEEKLYQKLAGIVHEPLLQVFVDFRKAYDLIDRWRCLEILRGYGLSGFSPR